MIVGIASGVIESLVAEAAIAGARECCGLLIGTPSRIEGIAVAANVAEHPERAFEIDPATLLRTHREARGAGRKVVGHYHSHPAGNPEPSLRDAARAVDNGQFWLIIAGGAVHGWQAVSVDHGGRALHGRFMPITLEIC